MLNPFPIQFLALLAYAILRVSIGAVLMYMGFKHLSVRSELEDSFSYFGRLLSRPLVILFIGAEIVAGAMLAAGFYTQIAALVVIALAVKLIVFHKHLRGPHFENRTLYLVLAASALSLFITGAGAFAFDLPI